VALAALFLSLGAVVAQVWAFWRGPQIRLLPPERVALFAQVAPDSTIAVRIGAQMSYANVAQESYGDLVRAEKAELVVGKVRSIQRWNSFGEIGTPTGGAAPQPLPGQSAVTHFTMFTPVPRECGDDAAGCEPMKDYISPTELTDQLRTATQLRFKFQIERFDGQSVSTSCYVPVSDLAKKKLFNIVSATFYATCHPLVARS
jgi:hypothetical protein